MKLSTFYIVCSERADSTTAAISSARFASPRLYYDGVFYSQTLSNAKTVFYKILIIKSSKTARESWKTEISSLSLKNVSRVIANRVLRIRVDIVSWKK